MGPMKYFREPMHTHLERYSLRHFSSGSHIWDPISFGVGVKSQAGRAAPMGPMWPVFTQQTQVGLTCEQPPPVSIYSHLGDLTAWALHPAATADADVTVLVLTGPVTVGSEAALAHGWLLVEWG